MREIATDAAPASIGPFSQAIVRDGVVHVSGQGPVDPETGDVVDDDVRRQTAQTMENIEAILEAAGTSLDDVVRSRVFLTDMDDYDAVNEIYAEFVSEPYPARSAVEVSTLPIDIKVEIEVAAALEE